MSKNFDAAGRPLDDRPLNVALCVIATGEYSAFLAPLVESARRFFLPGHRVRLIGFSDVRPPAGLVDISVAVEHEPWPGPTLHRYRSILDAMDFWIDCEYLFYVDADCCFVGTVGPEILGGITAVVHQGSAAQVPELCPFERRPESAACVPCENGPKPYYAGGFQGGRTADYAASMRAMEARIAADERAGVMARFHDESHWNRFLVDRPPDVALPPTYCCADFDLLPGAKLLALSKDHEALREC